MVYSSWLNFALIVTYYQPCGVKYCHNTVLFDRIFNLQPWGFCTNPLRWSRQNLPRESILVVYAYMPNFIQISLSCCSMVAPPSGAEMKLNAGAQLQTFPYPLVSKSFPCSNALMAMLSAWTPLFKSVTDKKTKKIMELFRYGGVQSPSPIILGTVMQKVGIILALQNSFTPNVHFTASRHWKFGGKMQPNFKLP